MRSFFLELLILLQACAPAHAAETMITGTYAPGLKSATKNYIKQTDCRLNWDGIVSSSSPQNISKNTGTPYITAAAGGQCRFNPGSGSHTVKVDIDTLDGKIRDGMCEAKFTTKANAVGDWVAYLEYDSVQKTTDLPLYNTASVAQNFSIQYPCGSSVTTRKLVFKGSSGAPAPLLVGAMSFGEFSPSSNPAAPTLVAAGEFPAGNSSCSWQKNGSVLGPFASDSDCPQMVIFKTGGVGTVDTTNTFLPKIPINNLPKGTYKVTIEVPWFSDVSDSRINIAIVDGTSVRGSANKRESTATRDIDTVTMVGWFTYTSDGNRTFQVAGAAASGSVYLNIGEPYGAMTFTIERWPDDEEKTVTLNQLQQNPTQTRYTSGSGTYTPPVGVKWIRVRMVGGGGGGSVSGNSGGAYNGQVGGNSTFGTSLLTANGGGGVAIYDTAPGGTGVVNSPAIGFAIKGGMGNASHAFNNSMGASGGNSFLGGAGGQVSNGYSGNAADANSGSGGSGGGGYSSGGGGSGGGGAGYVEATINTLAASYPYAVGVGGVAGTGGGGNAGGAGGSGLIIIDEFYSTSPYAAIKNEKNEINLDTCNGYGSTNTNVRRWTNAVSNGSAMTYADSAANGGSITVNYDGVYCASFTDNTTTANQMAVSINYTGSASGIGAVDSLAYGSNNSANAIVSISSCGYLIAGTIIRANTQGFSADSNARCRMRIVKAN